MSPGRFVYRHVGASGGCSDGRGNVLAVGNCCYVAVCSSAQGALAPTGEERGGAYHGGRPPTASLLTMTLTNSADGSMPVFQPDEYVLCISQISQNVVNCNKCSNNLLLNKILVAHCLSFTFHKVV